MCRPTLVLLVATGCVGGGGGKETGDTEVVETGIDSEPLLDSDTGSATETALDSDSGADTDTGGGTDTAPDRTTVELDLGVDADAKLVGEIGGDYYAGLSMAGAGDLNADGFADVVAGWWIAGGSSGLYGRGYLVNGPVSGTVGLGSADALFTTTVVEAAGYAVSSAGDVNSDGYGDLLVSAPGYVTDSSAPGRVYLVLGPTLGGDLADVAEATLVGEWVHSDYAVSSSTGNSIAPAGDVDDDGFDDFVIGAPTYDTYGAAYLVSGPVAGDVDLGTQATLRVTWNGSGGVAGAGDTNGDGFDDILVGSGGGTECGHAFIGPASGDVKATTDSDVSFVCDAEFSSGYDPAGAGDVDADGYDDVLIDSGADDEGAYGGGSVSLIHGPLPSTVDLSTVETKLYGTVERGLAGDDVAGAGDVNADGFADILIGAPGVVYFDGEEGTTYLVLGPVSGYLALDGADYIFHGEGGDDGSGSIVAGAGDVDGDGLDDILIGGPGDDDGGEDAGAGWLILGASLL